EPAPGRGGGMSSPSRDSISTDTFERLRVEIGADCCALLVDGVCFVAAILGFDRLNMPTLRFEHCLQGFPRLPFGYRHVTFPSGQCSASSGGQENETKHGLHGDFRGEGPVSW